MARYDYRCPQGHVTEHVCPMGEAPPSVLCADRVCRGGQEADRVFTAPAAIHFKGRGFYATDVKGALERKRRPNPGDSLHKEHQPDTAAIARAI